MKRITLSFEFWYRGVKSKQLMALMMENLIRWTKFDSDRDSQTNNNK